MTALFSLWKNVSKKDRIRGQVPLLRFYNDLTHQIIIKS